MTWRIVRAAVLGAGVLVAPPSRAQKDFSIPPHMDGAPPGSASSDRNTRFMLINDSDQTIDTLNISPSDDDSWGDDLLGMLALPSNSRVIAGPSHDVGCTFDVRVVYHDRREEVLRRQDLCHLRELSFTGRNARGQRTRGQSAD